MVIMKFGGTSVGKPERMHQVSQLITRNAEPTLVVLSALSGTTNALVEISTALASANKQNAAEKIAVLENFTPSSMDIDFTKTSKSSPVTS